MATDVIYRGHAAESVEAKAEGDNLWLSNANLTRVSGWELKPEGACLGEVCIPIPPARASEFIRDDGREFNLAALARHLGQPVVRDHECRVWYFGEAASTRRAALASLQAPDFELPDINGNLHRLSDYRGRKVLLAAWASW
jgi:AhpC/TSA family